ncbi:hypothetical protein WEI85_36265 [Actinomycetes bacterium KLBMP 9797]
MELELAAAAVRIVVEFSRRVLAKVTDRASDHIATEVFRAIDGLARSDPPTGVALQAIQRNPDDLSAAHELQHRLAQTATRYPQFRTQLHQAVHGTTVHIAAGGTRNPIVNNSGATNVRTKIDQSIRNITKTSGGLWLLVGAGVVALVVLATCTGTAFVFARENTTFFDTRTTLESSDGWRYRVSEANLETSPQLEKRGPARPGYQYLYFDITVENLLDDREAPGVGFHFARPESSLGADCGAQRGLLFSGANYTAGVVPGWCVSINGSLFGGASCFETNDDFFHTVDNIPPGGRNQVRCVDSYFVADDFDLESIRVYYVGASSVSTGGDAPHLTQIPTKT